MYSLANLARKLENEMRLRHFEVTTDVERLALDEAVPPPVNTVNVTEKTKPALFENVLSTPRAAHAFRYANQTGELKPYKNLAKSIARRPAERVRAITPFAFDTPSPDDVAAKRSIVRRLF